MQRIEDDDFEEIVMPDGSKRQILKDQGRLYVPMMMADAGQSAMRLHDGMGGPVGHRPGFICSTDAAFYEDKRKIYARYDAEISQAYRNPSTGVGSSPGREGDICTVGGAPEAAQRGSGGGVPGTLEQRQDARTALAARARAYADYDAEIANEWRGPDQ